MPRLDGKIAIVTGGAQGQGAAIARSFLEEGARVAIADLADDPGEVLAKELGDDAMFVHHDVGAEESWTALVVQIADTFGPVSVLANNAGVLRFGNIESMPMEDYHLVARVNQLGCFLGMRAVVPTMRAEHSGSIINSSSVEGLAGMGSLGAYTGTKFAIRGMTKAAALELGGANVRVNSVHPGMIDTGMTRVHGGDAAMEYGASRVPLKRAGLPEDVASLYVFLASEESSYITGAEIAIDGGVSATHAFSG